MLKLEELFGVKKPVIGMCHLRALPDDPDYDESAGMEHVIECARKDLAALQSGGIDSVMFSNEYSVPYLTKVKTVTVAAMARVIGELKSSLTVPFGVNVLWDGEASIDLAVATGASFVREIFSGAYASDFGIWDTDVGSVARHRKHVSGSKVRLFYNIVPESAMYLAPRNIVDIAKSTVFNCRPDALCISGNTAGSQVDDSILSKVKAALPDTFVFANTGLNLSTAERMLGIADGAIVGTFLKKDGYIWNPTDESRVKSFMDKVRSFRSKA
jgi:membrane complex biogenesis BtpA family protein